MPALSKDVLHLWLVKAMIESWASWAFRSFVFCSILRQSFASFSPSKTSKSLIMLPHLASSPHPIVLFSFNVKTSLNALRDFPSSAVFTSLSIASSHDLATDCSPGVSKGTRNAHSGRSVPCVTYPGLHLVKGDFEEVHGHTFWSLSFRCPANFIPYNRHSSSH
jgi:hypothetical protein